MFSKTDINYKDAKLIFSSLKEQGTKGSSIQTLSSETNISRTRLKRYMQQNKDFFCLINKTSRYTVNKFSRYKGDTLEMLETIEEKEKSVNEDYWMYYLFFFMTLIWLFNTN